MRIKKSLSILIILLLCSCSDDNNSSPNNNNNGNGSGNNSGCSGGPSTVTDIDGNTYNVVTIGNQCWMKENLKVSKYRNGDPIPTNLSDTQWQNTTNGAYSVYDNNASNNAIYGKLYNWYAVADPRELCPTGWHVPTDSEWSILVKTLDLQADTSLTSYAQSNIAGGLLKSTGTLQTGTGLWDDPNVGATNFSGFSGLPGGARLYGGPSSFISSFGWWWSSTQASPPDIGAYNRYLRFDTDSVFRTPYIEEMGLSVRCIRD